MGVQVKGCAQARVHAQACACTCEIIIAAGLLTPRTPNRTQAMRLQLLPPHYCSYSRHPPQPPADRQAGSTPTQASRQQAGSTPTQAGRHQAGSTPTQASGPATDLREPSAPPVCARASHVPAYVVQPCRPAISHAGQL